MPRYFFDIKDGHRFVDPAGLILDDDHDAMERAKIVAIGVAIDNPEIDPALYICVLNEARIEIFRVPVYSRQTIANAGYPTTLLSRRLDS